MMASLFLMMATASAETWYVQTGNGKPLNVRSGASTHAKMITRLSSGSAVEVEELLEDGAWAKITFGNRTGYCMTTFLAQGDRAVCKDLGYTLVYDESLFTLEEQEDMDVYWWNAQEEDKPNCFMSLSCVTGYSLDEVIDGLVLQSGVEGDRYTLALGGMEVPAYTFSEGKEEGDRLVQYVCMPRSDGSVLLIESDCYIGGEETIGQYLQEMLYSMTFSTQETDLQVHSSVQYVQCPDCGEWFEEGNVYRNHICPARSETPYVQCPDCGGWFEEGNEYRNHICPARSETPYVQCPDCGGWFEEGGVFRNHICPAQTKDEEEELVHCDLCGGWFKAGNEFRNHLCIS